MDWARILAYITGTVDQELLLRNEYLVAENRILKAQLKTLLRLTDEERMTLAEIAHRLGRKALEDVANVVKPDTLMGWYRRLVARKFDGSKSRRYPGRPRIDGVVRRWSCAWPERIRAGVMTELSELWRTWVTRYQIKLWVIFFCARVSLPRRNESERQLGQTLFVRTCLSLQVPTFSLSRF